MTASFTWWRKALVASFGPVHKNDPQPGFYRARERSCESGDPVVIFESAGCLKALRAGRPVEPRDVWASCSMTPITRETYIAVAERGEVWPEQTRALTRLEPGGLLQGEQTGSAVKQPGLAHRARASRREQPAGFAFQARSRSKRSDAYGGGWSSSRRPASTPAQSVARTSSHSAGKGSGQTPRIARSVALLPRR